jgi:Ice-binding-like
VTLSPGVICFTGTAVGLTGTVTLDAGGNPNAAWVIKTGSTLITASNSAVRLIGGATPCNNNNITWAVGSSATLGSATSFIGNILASASISAKTGATSTGSLYAYTGAVTMEANRISTCGGAGGLAGPALSTTPSGPVAVGGNISDSATVIGGAAPTGSVTFSLYGPGDDGCTGMPVATRALRPLVGGTATSGDVVAATPGTYNWVAVYSGDETNDGATSPCGSEQVTVGPTITGRAYGLTATATALGLPLVNVAPTPDTGNVSTNVSSSTTTPCRASLPGAVSANVLCANVTTDASTGTSKATASVDDTAVGIASIPAITVGAVKSTSTTTCSGSSGTTTIAYLKVGGTVVIAQPTAIAPNTMITLGVVKLVLNEQIAFSTPDDGLTVNAVHVTANALGLVLANAVVASSESDIGNCG